MLTTIPRSFYTIHSSSNTVYATKPPTTKISVVSFAHKSHAELIACMLEDYKLKTLEWPQLETENHMILPLATRELSELSIIGWTKDELDMYCVQNFLDLITVNDIKKSKSSFSLLGETYAYEVPDDTCKNILETKYLLPSQVPPES